MSSSLVKPLLSQTRSVQQSAASNEMKRTTNISAAAFHHQVTPKKPKNVSRPLLSLFFPFLNFTNSAQLQIKFAVASATLICGTGVTLMTKILYQTSAVGQDGTAKPFAKPWFTCFMMFVGMSFSLVIFAIWEYHTVKKRTGFDKTTLQIEQNKDLEKGLVKIRWPCPWGAAAPQPLRTPNPPSTLRKQTRMSDSPSSPPALYRALSSARSARVSSTTTIDAGIVPDPSPNPCENKDLEKGLVEKSSKSSSGEDDGYVSFCFCASILSCCVFM